MSEPLRRPIRVLVLFSDTGGGHRSAAEALAEAWRADHPGCVEVRMVDVFRDHTPFPFNRMAPSYAWLIRHFSGGYGATYHVSDGPRRAWALARASYPYVARRLRGLLAEHPADIIVSVHPLFNHCVSWAMRETGQQFPYVTVVTDLWTVHAFWFCPQATHIIVPTEGARQRGLRCGIPPQKITVRGLPVARKFTEGLRRVGNKEEVRSKLGLPTHGPVVLMVGGGDGLGPIYTTARAVEAAMASLSPRPQLVVITGRNAPLRYRLQATRWRVPVRVEGFVTNMPEWMAAADVLVTKAGPGTITEGLLSGLPLVLMGKVPGQEDGNVEYVVRSGVGVWAPRPSRVAAVLRQWLTSDRAALVRMSERARNLAAPDAASKIAADILRIASPRACPTPVLV